MEKIGSRGVGSLIKELLDDKGMTQKQLADKIGLDVSVVSRYVTGERAIKTENLANIATVLNTTTDYLLGMDERDENFNYRKVKALIARNASKMTKEQKRSLIDALFAEG